MEIHEIDNSAKDYGKVVLWQYDKAYNLIRVLRLFRGIYNEIVRDFWDKWRNTTLSFGECDDFGIAVWGIFCGVPRFILPDYYDGQKWTFHNSKVLSLDLYRRVIFATMYLKRSKSSLTTIKKYIDIIFGTSKVEDYDGIHRPEDIPYTESEGPNKRYVESMLSFTEPGISVKDNGDMEIVYETNDKWYRMTDEQRRLYEFYKDQILVYPAGIKDNKPIEIKAFGFEKQYEKSMKYPNVYVSGSNYVNGDVFAVELNEKEYSKVAASSGWINFKATQNFQAGSFWEIDYLQKNMKTTLDGWPRIGFFGEDPESAEVYGAIEPHTYNVGDVIKESEDSNKVYRVIMEFAYGKSVAFSSLTGGTNPKIVLCNVGAPFISDSTADRLWNKRLGELDTLADWANSTERVWNDDSDAVSIDSSITDNVTVGEHCDVTLE